MDFVCLYEKVFIYLTYNLKLKYMKNFKVILEVTSYVEVFVEAKDQDSAGDKALDLVELKRSIAGNGIFTNNGEFLKHSKSTVEDVLAVQKCCKCDRCNDTIKDRGVHWTSSLGKKVNYCESCFKLMEFVGNL